MEDEDGNGMMTCVFSYFWKAPIVPVAQALVCFRLVSVGNTNLD
jgi:hypothetical protein